MKYIFTLFSMFLIFNLFSQDLQLEKIETKKVKIKTVKEKVNYPIEVSLGYGKLLSFNNDSIVVSYTDPDFGLIEGGYNMLSFDTINNVNNYSSYNLGLRKRYGNFRLGLNSQFSYLDANYESPYQDWYTEDPNGTSLIRTDYESNYLNQNANILMLNLSTDYIFAQTSKIVLALGLNIGGLWHKFNYRYNATYTSYAYQSTWNGEGNPWTTTLTDVDSVYLDSKGELKNTAINISPTFSAEYKLSNAIKLQCSIFYNLQLNNKINSSGSFYYVVDDLIQSSESTSSGKSFYYNPSKVGVNFNLVISLGKERK